MQWRILLIALVFTACTKNQEYVTETYPDGTPKIKCLYHRNSDGSLGPKIKETHFSPEGEKEKEHHYDKNKKHDPPADWNKERLYFEEAYYLDTRLTKTNFYNKGKIMARFEYSKTKDGKYRTHRTYCHTNGNKHMEGEEVNNKAQGKWVYWHENGEKHREGMFKDGEKDGTWTVWNEDGSIKSTTVFKNNKIISQEKADDDK